MVRSAAMAMTECPDCGRGISTFARTCPDCGRPMLNPEEQPRPGQAWGCLISLILLAFALWALHEYFHIFFPQL